MHAVTGTGRVIAGRYRLQEPIGRGAMGIVWRGRDELLARAVAVKEVQITARASPADAEVIYQRTLREARTAARLSHPSVVTVFDVVEENGSPWIVMELIEARSLDRVITEDGPLPPDQAADLGKSLVSALATAHSAGVLHRDVKPGNVLVTKDGRAVLTDFGIATFAEDLGLTQQGMVVGTPGFTAPERIRGDIATPAADLWSLGATLYAAVEGRGPFDRAGGSSVITAGVAIEDAPRAPSAGPLGPVIDALLSRDPGTRPDASTAARLLADAAIVARTGPQPLSYSSDAAEADRDTADTPVPAAGRLGVTDSGFLDPPDYEVLQIPPEQAADGSTGSDERPVTGGATAAAGADGADGTDAAGAATQIRPGILDPGSGPALWSPVQTPGAAQPAGPAPAGGGGTGGGFGPAGGEAPAQRPWRSSRGWRLLVAAAGIAAFAVAAVIGWNIFQHSGSASALGSQTPPSAPAAGPGASHPGGGGSGNPALSKSPPAGSPGPAVPGAVGGPSTPPSGGTAGPSATASPTGRSSPSPSPSVTPSPSPTGPALPAGYRWHAFTAAELYTVAGFKIGMPDAWTQSYSAELAILNQPARGFHLAVNLSYWPYASPLREAQYRQVQAAASHKHGYRVLTLTSGDFQAVGGYRSASAAELKYTWKNALGSSFTELDILVTLLTSAGAQPYDFSLWAPSATFSAANGVLHAAMPTFRTLPA